MNCAPSRAVGSERQALIARGIVWNSLFQVFLATVNFVSMLVLVRLLSPAEFGRATAASGILTLINCFNCSYFIAQAIQLGDGEEPDWTAHWNAGFSVQFALALLCNAVAGAAWFFLPYRPMAPLLHVASIGLLIDCPNQLALTTLRREMNFRTLRIVQGGCVLLTAVSSVVLAMTGAGAYALIVASNVLHGIPLGFYFLVVRKWRPHRWWVWPDWQNYRASLKFGAQFSGSAVLTAARGLLESFVLPGALGYEAMGLLNRAQVLFSTTVGRVSSLVVETVYPLLPRSAGNPEQFARHATLFIQTMLLISVPGAVFVGVEGPFLSRLLYGSKWIAADPLIWPGTLFAWGVATVLILTAVLQAKNRLRMAFLSSFTAACLVVPAMLVALAGGGMRSYAWALAAGQFVAVMITFTFGMRLLQSGVIGRAVIAPAIATGLGGIALLIVHPITDHLRIGAKVFADAAVFATVVVMVMRCCFAPALREVVFRLPGRNTLIKALRL